MRLSSFTSAQTVLPETNSQNQTGYGYASSLLRDVNSATLQPEFSKPLRNLYVGMFIRDEFRVTQRLTLNYGLRFENSAAFHFAI